jgi:hypothetical protein
VITLPLSAQQSTTRGFMVGAHIGASSLKVRDSERSNGGGGGLVVGYGLNRVVTIFGQIDGSTVDVTNQPQADGTWALGQGDIGVRFHFANSLRSFVPYLQGALSIQTVNVTDIPASSPFTGQKVTFSGGAFTLGGGLMLYVKESVAFDLGLLFSGGEFTEVRVGNATFSGFDTNVQSTRFNIGVVWWP